MRHATLIVNPKAGAAHKLDRYLPAMVQIFTKHGFRVELRETTAAPCSARELAAEAAKYADLIVACGGDGTVHDVVQGIAKSRACLGVLPFGTANALARNLGLPRDPLAASEKLLTFAPRDIPLGVASTPTGIRRFTVMAGAGPDGRLVHEMTRVAKATIGRTAYYVEAARLFLLHRFPAFSVAYRAAGSAEWTSLSAVAMMASRIPDLGGVFRGLTSDSRLHHPHLVVKVLAALLPFRFLPGSPSDGEVCPSPILGSPRSMWTSSVPQRSNRTMRSTLRSTASVSDPSRCRSPLKEMAYAY